MPLNRVICTIMNGNNEQTLRIQELIRAEVDFTCLEVCINAHQNNQKILLHPVNPEISKELVKEEEGMQYCR